MSVTSEALEMAYRSISGRAVISKEAFFSRFEGWECEPLFVNGLCVGALLMNGPEVHACVVPEGFNKWLTPRIHRMIFRDRLKRYGFIETSAMADNPVGRQFIERLGFKLQSITNGIARYRYGH